jgi:hypothetical protein
MIGSLFAINSAKAKRRSVNRIKRSVIYITLVLAACGSIPRKVALDDPRIQPLLKAAASFDRTSQGFTPISKTAEVRWESKPTKKYDAMLHFDSKTSRTIAFRKSGTGWRWIGEQEIFPGPKQYKTVDGMFSEHVCLNYDIESISGFPTNQLSVTYLGQDSRLANRPTLSLADVRPILKEWGY